jgi:hypothetical protein
MKKGYIMVNIDIEKPEDWPAYRERSRPYVARNGGRYIVATNAIEEREGSFGLKRLVIIEFSQRGDCPPGVRLRGVPEGYSAVPTASLEIRSRNLRGEHLTSPIDCDLPPERG